MPVPHRPGNPATRNLIAVILLVVVALAAGCGGPAHLMETPNLYLVPGEGALDRIPECNRTSTIDVVYTTDREPVYDERTGELAGYSRQRSPYLQVGVARMEIGKGQTWEQVMAMSRSPKRGGDARLRLDSVEERFRYPGTPYNSWRLTDRSPTYEDFKARMRQTDVQFSELLDEQFSTCTKREVFLYVHGYNNDFEDSLQVMAGFWHFLGRDGVPMVFTWPAGAPGLTGYTTDRESGEYAIFHLKQLLTALSFDPDVEGVHILAHSRGTDVVCTALRELTIAVRARGENPRETLKIDNLILASPDIDASVFAQRFLAERLTQSIGRLTIFMSPHDHALALSRWLHGSVWRLGLLNLKKLSRDELAELERIPNMTIIDAKVSTNFIGHNYFYTNPAVTSDLVLLLRDGRPPGVENGRPLEPLAINFWRVFDGYPLAQPSLVEQVTSTLMLQEPEPRLEQPPPH